MNTFEQDAAWAVEQLRAGWWEQVYQRAFQDVLAWNVIDGRSRAQENGVDHVVTLARDKILRVEVKCRRPRRDGTDYPDVLLETHSCWQRLTPGWIEKPLTADFFAYAFVRSRAVLLLPLLNLQAAWRANKAEWERLATEGLQGAVPVGRLFHAGRAGFGVALGSTRLNGGHYNTRNLAVPTLVLGEAVKNSMRVPFDAPEAGPPPPDLTREQLGAPAPSVNGAKQLVLWEAAESTGRAG